VDRVTSDEFGTLAECFNGMAEHLQSMYRDLEAKVAAKTSELEEKRERLEALYGVTALSRPMLPRTPGVRRIARWRGRRRHCAGRRGHQRFLLLASVGLPTM
jgi:two-component system nitrate/nitrite sensor histidine kinase NarX